MKDCNLDQISEDVKFIKSALCGDEYNKTGLIQSIGQMPNFKAKIVSAMQ